eukprot:Platyproteum_vivax@DN1339_c0_g1_i1.p1
MRCGIIITLLIVLVFHADSAKIRHARQKHAAQGAKHQKTVESQKKRKDPKARNVAPAKVKVVHKAAQTPRAKSGNKGKVKTATKGSSVYGPNQYVDIIHANTQKQRSTSSGLLKSNTVLRLPTTTLKGLQSWKTSASSKSQTTHMIRPSQTNAKKTKSVVKAMPVVAKEGVPPIQKPEKVDIVEPSEAVPSKVEHDNVNVPLPAANPPSVQSPEDVPLVTPYRRIDEEKMAADMATMMLYKQTESNYDPQ